VTLPLVISPNDPGHLGDHEEIHGLLANAQSPFDNVALDGADLFANRPAAGTQGRYFYATDTGVIYRDTGSAWQAWSSLISDLIASILQASPTLSGLRVPTSRVTKSVGQSVPDGILGSTVVTFDVESSSTTWDNDSIHSVSSNTGRLVAPRSGYYLAGTHVVWATSTTGQREVRLRQSNPVGNFVRDDRVASSGTDHMAIAGACRLGAGEYAEVVVAHSAGAPLNVGGGSSFWLAFVSDL